MTVKKIIITNRDTTPGQGLDKNQFVKAGDFNPLVDAHNALYDSLNGIIFNSYTTTTLTTSGSSTTAPIDISIPGVSANSIVTASIAGYSGTLQTNGVPYLGKVTAGTNKITIVIVNVHGANPLNGTVTINYIIK